MAEEAKPPAEKKAPSWQYLLDNVDDPFGLLSSSSLVASAAVSAAEEVVSREERYRLRRIKLRNNKQHQAERLDANRRIAKKSRQKKKAEFELLKITAERLTKENTSARILNQKLNWIRNLIMRTYPHLSEEFKCLSSLSQGTTECAISESTCNSVTVASDNSFYFDLSSLEHSQSPADSTVQLTSSFAETSDSSKSNRHRKPSFVQKARPARKRGLHETGNMCDTQPISEQTNQQKQGKRSPVLAENATAARSVCYSAPRADIATGNKKSNHCSGTEFLTSSLSPNSEVYLKQSSSVKSTDPKDKPHSSSYNQNLIDTNNSNSHRINNMITTRQIPALPNQLHRGFSDISHQQKQQQGMFEPFSLKKNTAGEVLKVLVPS